MIEVTEDFYFEFIERPEIKRLLHGGGCAWGSSGKIHLLDRGGTKMTMIKDDRFYLADRFASKIPDRSRPIRKVYVEITSAVLIKGLMSMAPVPELRYDFERPRPGMTLYLTFNGNHCCWEHDMDVNSQLIKNPDEFVRIVKERLACKK
jgi:hypothetical protein